ncbi:SAM-dependent methyltransferase [Streptomyces litchfieldiae]|uniref:SAM-dependent methyltransferase n=1 Tax=Streptomyces litchfieldiae TaxID=3075543 RepID=A0ABU2MZK7_9ACTN|nr:SAM-dependent methyltransferase [Streptomyces sp. DSM 44938]MDT0347059.1 SAM-dependent methyltransferase [Streptomyces sp. DSM 44938]
MSDDASPIQGIDTSVPRSARVWNYWLGGKDNYTVDRAAADAYAEIFPGIVDIALVSRYWLERTVRYLAGEAGGVQFLDVGSGLPAADNTHEIAQRITPGARIVYVDHDPLVLAHARGLLTSTPEGAAAFVHADLREPEKILEGAARTLDLTRPVALMLVGVLGHIEDYDEARSIVNALMDGLPSGSFLALYDGIDTELYVRANNFYNQQGGIPYVSRSPGQIAGYFDRLALVPPGITELSQWRPERLDVGRPTTAVDAHGGVARKP